MTSNDSGTYLCMSTITPQDMSYGAGANNSDSETIEVFRGKY